MSSGIAIAISINKINRTKNSSKAQIAAFLLHLVAEEGFEPRDPFESNEIGIKTIRSSDSAWEGQKQGSQLSG